MDILHRFLGNLIILLGYLLVTNGFEISPGGTNLISLTDTPQTVHIRYSTESPPQVTGQIVTLNNRAVEETYFTINNVLKSLSVVVDPLLFGSNYGIHQLTLTAASATIDIFIFFEAKVDGLPNVTRPYYCNINDTYLFEFDLVSGSNVLGEWMMSDRSILQVYSGDVDKLARVHACEEIGTTNITLVASNNASSDFTSFEITVQHPINSINFTTLTPRVETNETARFKVDLLPNVKLPMGNVSATITYHTGENQTTSLLPDPQKYTFSKAFVTQGFFETTLMLVSESSNGTFNTSFSVWDKLNMVTIEPTSTAAKVGELVVFKFQTPPFSGFQYNVSFGNGESTNNTADDLYLPFYDPPLNTTYPNPITYNISSMVFNPLDNFNITTSVIIQYPIVNVTMNPKTLVIPIKNATVYFTLTLAENTHPPTDASCTLDFGDGSLSKNIAFNITEDYSINFEYHYTQEGDFNVSVQCNNLVTTMNFAAIIGVRNYTINDFILFNRSPFPTNYSEPRDVEMRIKLKDIQIPPPMITVDWDFGDGITESINFNDWIKIHRYPKRGIYNGNLTIHMGDKSRTITFTQQLGTISIESDIDVVLATNPVNFTVTALASGGEPLTFEIDFKDGTDPGIGASVSHSFAVGGFYYPVVKAYNSTFIEYSKIDRMVTVENPITSFVEQYPAQVNYPDGALTLSLGIEPNAREITFVTCTYNFGDSIDKQSYQHTDNVSDTHPISYTYYYPTLGPRMVTYECKNNLTGTNGSFNIEVLNECFKYDGIFDRQYAYITNPMRIYRSKLAQITNRLTILCINANPQYEWGMLEFDENGTKSTVPLVQPGKDFIQFPKSSIDKGIYCLTLNISFQLKPNKWYVESTFLEFRNPPIRAEIVGGFQRTSGMNDGIIDGESLSYDPLKDLGETEGLEYSWSCSRVNSTTVPQLLDLYMNDSQPINCDTIAPRITSGRLSFKGSTLTSAVGYTFHLTVSKPDRLHGTFLQVIQVLYGAPDINIICKINCEIKTAVTSELSVESICKSCKNYEYPLAVYTWNLLQLISTDQNLTQVEDLQSKLINSVANPSALVLKKNVLLPGREYRLEVTVDIPGRLEPGYSSYQLRTNLPPYNGSCSVTPKSGIVTRTTFQIFCKDYMDEGFRRFRDPIEDKIEPLTYKYMIRKDNISIPLDDGAESTSQNLEVPIFPGAVGNDYQLVATIYDILQDSAEFVMDITLTVPKSNATIANDAVGEVQTIVQDNERAIEETNLSGSTVRFTRIVNSVVSVVQSIPLPDNTLLFSTVETSENSTAPDWNTLYSDFITPKDTAAEEEISRVGKSTMKALELRKEDVDDLNGQGVTQLSLTVANIMRNPKSTALDSALMGANIAASTGKRLETIANRRPYPTSDHMIDAVAGMTTLMENVLNTVVPQLKGRVPVLTEEFMLQEVQESGVGGEGISREEAAHLAYKIAENEQARVEKQKNASRSMIGNLEDGLDKSQNTLSSLLVLGQEAKTIVKTNMLLTARKLNPDQLSKEDVVAGDFTINIPTANETGLPLNDPLDIQATVFKNNPYTWGKNDSSYDIESPVIKMKVKNGNGSMLKIPMTLRLKNENSPTFKTFDADETVKGDAGMHYHTFRLRKVTDTAVIHVALPSLVGSVVAYMRINKTPKSNKYDYKTVATLDTLRGGQVYKMIAPANSFKETGIIVAGLLFLEDDPLPDSELSSLPRTRRSLSMTNTTVNGTVPLSNVHINTSFSGNAYGVLLTTDGCRVWDDTVETWDPKACTVSPYSTPDETICVCDDPPGTSFASAFYVPPNTIDFDVIWTKFDISNAAVYGTLIAILVVYCFILIWARRMDEKDLDRWRVGYLRDNLVDDKYFYLITVYTGLRKGAGTQSGIHFVMAGECGDTGARSLYDGKRNFDTGSVLNLICSTSVDLGDLSYFRVWHDNTGRGTSASWFLGKMIVQDLQNQKRYIFENNRWLGIDKDDGMIDRLIPVTSQDDLMTFDKLFSSHARLNLTDSHLWLSVFMRPDKSTFSRVQRVSCCLALLFLTMIVNAMFFKSENETTDEETIRQEFQIGILRFSMSTIFTSFISVIITVPPTVLLVFLFKSSKPSKNYFKVKPKTGCCFCCKKPGKSDNLVIVEGDEVLDNMDDGKLLPHYCINIAWMLVAVIVMICAFFLVLYSMQWGKPISEEWLTSFFLAFVENMFVLDPMKVLMISLLLALCAKSPYNHNGKVDVSKVKKEVKRFGLGEVDLSQLPPDPIPETLLEKAKERRKQELKAQSVFLDLILYAVFLFGLYCVCYGNRDTQSFAFNSHIKKAMFTDSFEQINSYDDFFEWVDKTMLPTMFPNGDFRGDALDWRRKLFFYDHVNFRVGPARLRQVRIKQRPIPFYGSKYAKLMENYEYYWSYSSFKEEKTPFCPGWTPQPCPLDVRLASSTLDAWVYTTSEESNGSSTSGNLEVYGGGGYFLELSINKDISLAMVEEIKKNGWLDRQTRAVFVEFSLYNANNNLLTVVRLIAEFPEFGSVITWKHISTLRVFQNVGPIGAFIILCEVIVVIILFVFGFKCLKRLFKERLRYFDSFWNIVDLITFITTLVTIIFFILREVYTSKTLEIFRADPKKFVNFEHIVLWDALFVYGLSFLVFTATIGMLRILGYNRRFTMIGEVLKVSAKDLIGFTSVFCIFYSAFIASGYVLFATSLYQFRSAFDTAITIFIYLLGKNQLGKRLIQSDEYSVIYFFALVFFVIFILLTMFQVIMNNSMTVVRSNVTSIPAPYGIVNVLTGIYKSLISDWIPSGFLHKKDERAVQEMEARRQRSQVHNILESFKDQFEKSMDVKGASANYKQGFFNLGARLEEEEEVYTFPRQNPSTSFPQR